MIEVAIIGAGQLGSRHLQGILKSHNDFAVTIVDPSEQSLEIAEQRAKEIEHQHSLRFVSKIQTLPTKLDLVIVATNSNVRLKVLQELLEHAKVSTLVLEKVLFQKIEEYETARLLLLEHGVDCYVNHPRRMQSLYRYVRQLLAQQSQESYFIHAYGSNWGLGCNGLHISDMLEFVFDDSVIAYTCQNLDPKLIDSKRAGFKEFSGSIDGLMKKNHQFRITSEVTSDAIPTSLTIVFNSPSFSFTVHEGGKVPTLTVKSDTNSLEEVVTELEPMRFQSDLSCMIIDKIILGQKIDLPSYEQARRNHQLFISNLLNNMELNGYEKTEICPIT